MADTIKLANKGVLLAKIETAYGSDPTPTPQANSIRAEGIKIEAVWKKMTRNFMQPYMGQRKVVNIGEGIKLTFKTELKGSGTKGNAPEAGPLFRACNYTQSLTANTKADYDPNSLLDSAESITIYFYLDGLLHKAVGCRGTCSLEGKAGEYGYLSWEFTGIFAGPTDDSNPTPTWDAVVPPRLIAASFAYDTYAAVIESLKIAMGNEITRRPSANAATGILQYMIKDRKPTANIDPEVVTLATKSFWTLMTASTESALTCTWGSADGNKVIVAAPKCMLDDLKYGERENILTHDIPLILTPNTGNDELQFSFSKEHRAKSIEQGQPWVE
jgi:hypothetical protein